MKHWLNVTIYVLMLISWILFFFTDRIIHSKLGIWVDSFGAFIAICGMVTAILTLRDKR